MHELARDRCVVDDEPQILLVDALGDRVHLSCGVPVGCTAKYTTMHARRARASPTGRAGSGCCRPSGSPTRPDRACGSASTRSTGAVPPTQPAAGIPRVRVPARRRQRVARRRPRARSRRARARRRDRLREHGDELLAAVRADRDPVPLPAVDPSDRHRVARPDRVRARVPTAERRATATCCWPGPASSGRGRDNRTQRFPTQQVVGPNSHPRRAEAHDVVDPRRRARRAPAPGRSPRT